MQVFYFEEMKDQHAILTTDESRHCVKVLRKQLGDRIYATNGKGLLIEGTLVSSGKKCLVHIQRREEQKPPPYNLNLAVVPTKNMSRIEWLLEKSIEFGLSGFYPVFSRRSERKKINTERLEKIALAAMKQSKKYFKTKIGIPVSFKEFLSKSINGKKFIAHCDLSMKRENAFKVFEPHGNLWVLIGPEGDFEESEIQRANKEGFMSIHFGDSRFRTETAGLIPSSILYHKLQSNED